MTVLPKVQEHTAVEGCGTAKWRDKTYSPDDCGGYGNTETFTYPYNSSSNSVPDTVWTVTVTVYPKYDFTDAASWDTIISCEPSVTINGMTYDKSGTYNITFESVHGCDSIVKKTILINNPAATSSSGQTGFVSYEFDIGCSSEPDIYDTLDFGKCEMMVPLSSKIPEVTHHFQNYFSNYLQNSITITDDAPADGIFDVGEHVITWTATDDCGNTATCSKILHVAHRPCPPAIDYDGNTYSTVRIGCDCWLAENLRNEHYANGDTVLGNRYYNDDSTLLDKYGRLYTWSAAMDTDALGYPKTGLDNTVQGVCPDGWRLPTQEDFDRMVDVSGGLANVKSNENEYYWLHSLGGTDPQSGFNALPGGYYNHGYHGVLGEGYFWVYNQEEITETVGADILYYCSDALYKPASKECGFSVRCIKAPEKKTFKVGDVIFSMRVVDGCTFLMGAQNSDPDGQNYDAGAESNEESPHEVTLPDFYIGETEVTQALWLAVVGSWPGTEPNSIYGVNDDYPAYYVNYDDIQGFLSALNASLSAELNGLHFALPTEAQWEYAARGGIQRHDYKYAGSNSAENVAWYMGNSDSQTHPVGQKHPNELGLRDMSGNVWEWCSDRYEGHYSSDAITNPHGPDTGLGRVIRGGSWLDGDPHCRVSHRSYNAYPNTDDGRTNTLGFRLVLIP